LGKVPTALQEDPISQLAAQLEQQDQAIQGFHRNIDGIHKALANIESGQQAMGQSVSGMGQAVEALQQAAEDGSGAAEVVTLPPPFPYEQTAEQASLLFAALAEWQLGATNVAKADRAEVQTSSGGTARYSYANLGDTMEVARTVGQFGLCVTHRVHRFGKTTYVEAILFHKGGGYLSSGPVRLTTTQNRLLSPMQQLMHAVTTARRITTQMVLGVASAEDDNDSGRQPRSAPPEAGRYPEAYYTGQQDGRRTQAPGPPGRGQAAASGPPQGSTQGQRVAAAASQQAAVQRPGATAPIVRRPREGQGANVQTTYPTHSGAN
jgi:hypothetical protein